MPQIAYDELKLKAKKKRAIAFIFRQQYASQVTDRLNSLVTDSYLDVAVKSIPAATWSQDRTCYRVVLSPAADTMFDLRPKAVSLIVDRLRLSFPGKLITTEDHTFTIYK